MQKKLKSERWDGLGVGCMENGKFRKLKSEHPDIFAYARITLRTSAGEGKCKKKKTEE
jgi:hypothetical protein